MIPKSGYRFSGKIMRKSSNAGFRFRLPANHSGRDGYGSRAYYPSSMRVSRTKPSKGPGEGPRAPRAVAKDSSQDDTLDPRGEDPAVILDGALKDAASSDNPAPATPQPQVNRLI